ATFDPVTGAPAAPSTPGTPPASPKEALYIVSELPPNLATPTRVEAFNLADYFNSLGGDEEHDSLVQKSLEEIKQIVMTTLHAVDPSGNSGVTFQFHSGANLLVVVGTPGALEVANKVIGALGPQRVAGGPPGGAGGGLGWAAPPGFDRATPFATPY